MANIENTDFHGTRALIRVDFNVPLNENLEVADDTRMKAALPTINRVTRDGGTAILMSHLGRPKNGYEERFSLRHLTGRLQKLSGCTVKFAQDCTGEEAEKICSEAAPGEIVLLENLRFHPEEAKGDEHFARALAKLGGVYINDAFGTAHRAHASTTVVARFFEQKKMFGYLMLQELNSLEKALKDPIRPVTAVLGGAKIAGKIDVITNLLELADHIVIGGGMSFTFIKAGGGQVGNSLVDMDKLEIAKDIIQTAKKKKVAIHLPVDCLVSREFSNDGNVETAGASQIPEGWIGMDIGPETIANFSEIVNRSKTIVWNGPMGVFEMPRFEAGSKTIAKAIASATGNGAYSLIGGGDSVAAVNRFGLAGRMSYVSTGGGAMLEYMEGKKLPGVEAILN